MEDFGLETRVIRYHNVYDPKGVYDGGRKKISYIIKKIALAKINNKKEIEVWGD